MNSFKYLLGKICGCPWPIFCDYMIAFFLLSYKSSLYIEDNVFSVLFVAHISSSFTYLVTFFFHF